MNPSGTTEHSSLKSFVEENGYAILPVCLDNKRVEALCSALDETIHGQRNLLDLSIVQDLALSQPVCEVMHSVLGPDCCAVKGILFNKTREANWKVAWHQDLTITVSNRIEVDGFGPWTTKDGVLNVQPPAEILSRVLAIRLHLDDSYLENGPLRVIPGSHRHGRLSSRQIADWDKSHQIICTVPKGGAILMRPLLLHASSACISPRNRRVTHLEFTATELPSELEWRTKI